MLVDFFLIYRATVSAIHLTMLVDFFLIYRAAISAIYIYIIDIYQIYIDIVDINYIYYIYFKLDKSLNFLKQHSMQRDRCKRRHFAQHLFFKMVASILECYFLIKYVYIYLRRNLKNLIHKNIFVMYICGAWSTLLLIGSQLFV